MERVQASEWTAMKGGERLPVFIDLQSDGESVYTGPGIIECTESGSVWRGFSEDNKPVGGDWFDMRSDGTLLEDTLLLVANHLDKLDVDELTEDNTLLVLSNGIPVFRSHLVLETTLPDGLVGRVDGVRVMVETQDTTIVRISL